MAARLEEVNNAPGVADARTEDAADLDDTCSGSIQVVGPEDAPPIEVDSHVSAAHDEKAVHDAAADHDVGADIRVQEVVLGCSRVDSDEEGILAHESEAEDGHRMYSMLDGDTDTAAGAEKEEEACWWSRWYHQDVESCSMESSPSSEETDAHDVDHPSESCQDCPRRIIARPHSFPRWNRSRLLSPLLWEESLTTCLLAEHRPLLDPKMQPWLVSRPV